MNLVDFEVFPLPDDTHLSVKGENQKNIVVFYKKSEKEGDDLNFLEKVLAAIQINTKKDICLVRLEKEQQTSLSALKGQHDINIVLLFGITTKQLGINFEIPNYHPFQLQDIQFLLADSLGSILKNGQKKRQLWESLKLLSLDY